MKFDIWTLYGYGMGGIVHLFFFGVLKKSALCRYVHLSLIL
jgi:hypothetical protein